MKTLARKVEEFIDASLGETSAPKYFSTFGENVKERPFIGVHATTGWSSKYEFQHGERTASVIVTVESNADEDNASDHDAIAAEVEAALGDRQKVFEGAATVAAFTLTTWVPGESSTSVEDRVRTTTFTYSARVRDDNRNNP